LHGKWGISFAIAGFSARDLDYEVSLLIAGFSAKDLDYEVSLPICWKKINVNHWA
jgi:hypothetical protein